MLTLLAHCDSSPIYILACNAQARNGLVVSSSSPLHGLQLNSHVAASQLGLYIDSKLEKLG